MLVRAVSATLPVPPEEAFAFLADLENLPRWATEFITGEFEMRGDHARAETGAGRVILRFRSDPATGVVDHVAESEAGGETVFPARVLPFPGDPGRSLFVFTALQGPGQPDEAFEKDLRSLDRELEGLANLLDGAASRRAARR